MDILEKAVAFATKAHEGKSRKGSGLPYIVHPIEVVVIISAMSRDSELMAAGALHDVPEDAKITLEEIRAEFGERVAQLVAANTEDKHRDLPAEVTWKQRKEETVRYLCEEATYDEKILILADKLLNLRGMYHDLRFISAEKYWKRFNQSNPVEHCWYHSAILVVTAELSKFDKWQEYRELIRKVFE